MSLVVLPDTCDGGPDWQQLAAAKLGDLLTVPAPRCRTWHIYTLADDDIRLSGDLDPRSLDLLRIALHQWAAVLDDPVWALAMLGGDSDAHWLSVFGTHLGVRVEVGAEVDDSVTAAMLAELSAPPDIDLAAAQEHDTEQGSRPAWNFCLGCVTEPCRRHTLISATAAAHVLAHFNRAGGYRAGSFTRSLIHTIASADVFNQRKLAAAYPGYVAAVQAAQIDVDGITVLQVIATGPDEGSTLAAAHDKAVSSRG
jgi:hypothetical protein